ncbi:MAG: FMN-binding protein [Firmicutes bacterium]|nr:FMN-binding protein [Bacillota bacterium]
MKKIKILSILLVLVMSVGLLGACGTSEEPASNEGANEKSAANYEDGSYKAVYDRFDSHGWKSFVNITVKDGKISDVEFDYKNREGKLKTKNEGYKNAMEGKSGTYPEKYTKELEEQLVASQSVEDVDVVTGATHSSHNFKVLANKALEHAKKGDTSDAVINLLKDGTYKVAYKSFDDHGWKGQVELEVKDGKISNVNFDYVNEEGKLKTKDEGYKSAMKEKSGTYPAEFTKKLEERLVENQKLSEVDAVTGATSSSSDFKALASKALALAESGEKTEATIASEEE